MTNVAFLFSGRIRSSRLEETTQHIKDLQAHLQGIFPDGIVKYFFSVNQDIATDDEQNTKLSKSLQMSAEDMIRTESVEVPPHIYNQTRQDTVNVPNSYSMYFHNLKAFEMMQSYEMKNNLSFDIVIKYRIDVLPNQVSEQLFDNVPLQNLLQDSVYIPCEFDWLGLNDQIAIGSRTVMQQQTTCFHFIDRYCNEGTQYHPESLLCKHMLKVPQIRFKYGYHIFR